MTIKIKPILQNKVVIVLWLMIFFVLTGQMSKASPKGKEAFYPVYTIDKALKENANAVVRYSNEVFKLENKGKAVHTKHYVITILNGNAKRLGQCVVNYDKLNKFGYLKGTLYDASGKKIKTLKSKDISDFSANDGVSLHNDSRLKVADLKHSSYPYTVEFEYETTTINTLFYPRWVPHRGEDIAVEQDNITIIAPDDLTVRYNVVNWDVEVETKQNGGKKIMNCSVSNLKALEYEPHGRTFWQQVPYISFAPSEFKLGAGNEGDASSWKSLGQFYHELNSGRDELSEEKKAELDKLLVGANSDKEKIRRIYEHLQNTTRYVGVQLGVGGWQTFDAAYVEKNGYGDCKALTNYTKAMLNAADIEAYAALVRAGTSSHQLDPDFCTKEFNHVILFVPLAEDSVWLECTSQESPFNYLSDFTSDRYVLVNKPEGGELLRTPKETPEKNLQTRTIQLELTIEGHAEVSVNTHFSGNQHDDIRRLVERIGQTEQEEWLYENLPLPSFELNRFKFGELNKKSPVASLSFDASVLKYASSAGKRLFFNPNVLNRWGNVPKEVKDRKQSVLWTSPFLDADTTYVSLPEGYIVETMPKAVEISNEFGAFKSFYGMTEDGAKMQYIRSFQMNKFNLPAEKYIEFRNFLKAINKADKQKVVLVKSE
ncbi:MAG: DUF3857 domain-containing protein [Chitinophagales bacterium]